MILKEVIEKSVLYLDKKGIESSRLEAEYLVGHALNLDRLQMHLRLDQPLTEQELKISRGLVMERGSGKPLGYVLGYQYFWGRAFYCGPGVLIPRYDSECLIEKVLKLKLPEDAKFLDFGSGSGCLGITLLLEIPRITGYLIESSPIAGKYLVQNLDKYSIFPEQAKPVIERVEHFKSTEKFDLIIGNPPYIDEQDPEVSEEVRRHEPREALFADENGLRFHRSWAMKAFEMLKSDGFLIFETGYLQKQQVMSIFKEIGFVKIESGVDLSGAHRFVMGVKGES